MRPEQRQVRSADGTSIGVLVQGRGPALVFVHGSLTTGEEWLPVAGALSDRFTCHIMSRRGRGRSGDAAAYSIDRECDDIEAVLDAAGTARFLLGHSYGAVCVLETARRSDVGGMILYEPPLPIDGTVVAPEVALFREAVANGRLEEALEIGLRDLVRLHDDQLSALRGTTLWSQMSALTPSWTREIDAIGELELGVERFRRIAAPTLLLVGTITAPHHVTAVDALQRALPDARTVRLDGHGHEAHIHAPDLVASLISSFLEEAPMGSALQRDTLPPPAGTPAPRPFRSPADNDGFARGELRFEWR